MRAELPTFLRRFPGVVLQLSPAGVVMASNGRLERETGRELVGVHFEEVLDADSSAGKWRRFLAAPPRRGPDDAEVVELVLRAAETLPEPRAFSLLRDAERECVWLIELRADPRMEGLREEVTGVNTELANTQRELLKERGRLSRALAELEEKHAEAERLGRMVREQNEALEATNRSLTTLAGELRSRGEELERSNRDLDEFAHVISHDLKAPLRAVASYAAWLEEDLAPALSGESAENLRRLRDRTGRMQAMIDGVLEYARAGRERAPTEEVDVGALLRSVVELLDPPASLHVEIGPMPTLTSERAPLQQVFLNLLANAIRFAAPGGRVRVCCRRADGEYEFAVSDDGPGIPASRQEKIWALFHTLAPAGSGEGTGIGLAVVRRLVEARGGEIRVESEEGAGATFRFRWPTVQPAGPNH